MTVPSGQPATMSSRRIHFPSVECSLFRITFGCLRHLIEVHHQRLRGEVELDEYSPSTSGQIYRSQAVV
jgi:hypothetical protein